MMDAFEVLHVTTLFLRGDFFSLCSPFFVFSSFSLVGKSVSVPPTVIMIEVSPPVLPYSYDAPAPLGHGISISPFYGRRCSARSLSSFLFLLWGLFFFAGFFSPLPCF